MRGTCVLRLQEKIGEIVRCHRIAVLLNHAAAKRADLSHRKTSRLKGWVENPRSSQTEGDQRERSSNAAKAASFNPPESNLSKAGITQAHMRFPCPSRGRESKCRICSDSGSIMRPAG